MGSLIGVDLGTTNIKAIAFAENGAQLAKATIATPTKYPRPDWAQYDPEALWNCITQVLGKVIRSLGPAQAPSAIGFTGMAEAAVPLNAAGQPTYDAISWFDRRVLPQLDWWQKTIGAERTARITGLPLSPAAGILRLLWLRENQPEEFSATTSWLNLPDYFAFRLSGVMATEYSLASRMMIFDLALLDWSDDLLEQCGLDRSYLADPKPSSERIGAVTASAATDTGLPQGLPVCTGGHDHLCAAAGIGATGPGDIFDSIGTAEAVVISFDQYAGGQASAADGMATGRHVLPNKFYAITGNGFGGGSIDWARSLLHGDIADQDSAFAAMVLQADEAGLGAGGAMFLPHLRRANPPIDDPLSRGAFIGLSSDCGRGHLARAVMEGLAYEFQRILDALKHHFTISPTRMLASGGGTRNALFMQIKADVSGLPIHVPGIAEATCFGAATAAGIGAGVHCGFDDAVSKLDLTYRIFDPDMGRHKQYRERYEQAFLGLYDALKSTNHRVSEWVKTSHQG